MLVLCLGVSFIWGHSCMGSSAIVVAHGLMLMLCLGILLLWEKCAGAWRMRVRGEAWKFGIQSPD